MRKNSTVPITSDSIWSTATPALVANGQISSRMPAWKRSHRLSRDWVALESKEVEGQEVWAALELAPRQQPSMKRWTNLSRYYISLILKYLSCLPEHIIFLTSVRWERFGAAFWVQKFCYIHSYAILVISTRFKFTLLWCLFPLPGLLFFLVWTFYNFPFFFSFQEMVHFRIFCMMTG